MAVKVNYYTTKLTPKNQTKNTFLGLWENEFNQAGLEQIKAHFFNSDYCFSAFEVEQILNANKINVLKYANEIKAWNYDLRGWLLAQRWANTFHSLEALKIKSIYSLYDYITYHNKTYKVKMEGEFVDREWTWQNGKWQQNANLSTTHDFILEAGRLPQQANEVLTTSWNSKDVRFQIGDKFVFKKQEYVVVGTGFTYFKYLYHEADKENRPPTIWFHNLTLHDYWVTQQNNNDNGRYIDYFVNGNNTEQWATFLPHLLSYLDGDLDLYLAGESIIVRKFNIIILQTMLFFLAGIFIFIINVFIVKNFLKKELIRQQASLGLLLALGYHKHKLILVIVTSYLPILLVAIGLGFGASFGFQHFLLFIMNQIIYILMEYLTTTWWLSMLLLFVLPLGLIIIMAIFLQHWLARNPLVLINHNIAVVRKAKVSNKNKTGGLYQYFNFKIMVSFAHSNWKKIVSAVTCFFITTFDQTTNYFHWVSEEEFTAEIKKPQPKYREVRFDDLRSPQSLFNKYLTPKTVAVLTQQFSIVKKIIPNLAKLFENGMHYWKNNKAFPYFTFGFKLFRQQTSIAAINQQAIIEPTTLPGPNNINVIAYQNAHFLEWIRYQNAFNINSIKELNTINLNYLNAILPLQMVKNLRVKYGDVIKIRLQSISLTTDTWLTIPIRVIGANVYNYASNDVLITIKPLLSYLLKHYYDINPTAKVNIITPASFYNMMLVKAPLPEINYNVSFQSSDYSDFNQMHVGTDLYHYIANNYETFNATSHEINRISTALLFSLLILTVIVFITFFITLLVILNIIVSENGQAISGLKILGYFNKEIVGIIMFPYLLGFIISMLIITSGTYFLVKMLFEILFNFSGTLFLVDFSYELFFGFIFGCSSLMIASLMITYWFVSKQSFSVVIVE